MRDSAANGLLRTENRNYGFGRNLLGLKRFGRWCGIIVLIVSVALGIVIGLVTSWKAAFPLLLPVGVSIVALVLWRYVDAAYVKPSADAYADRLIESLDKLPSASS